MAKANYSKVEEALKEGLLKMTMQQLHALTDGKPHEIQQEQGRLIAALKIELNWIKKNDPSIFTHLELNKEEIKKLIENSANLTPEDWKTLLQVKTHIEAFKKEFIAQHPDQSDNQLIEKERVKHVNKRFNTNEKWLPLH